MFSVKLDDKENLVTVFRQTEWVLAKTVLIIFALIYIPWSFIFKYELASIFFKLMAVWSVLCLFYFIHQLILWFVNCTILTDKRIVLVRYPRLLHRILEDFELKDISAMSIEKKGFINNIFDIGQIIFSFQNHPEHKIIINQKAPEKIKAQILNVKNS